MANQASQYRGLLRLFTGVGLFCFYPAYLGGRGVLPPTYGLMAGMVAVLCLFTGAYFGWKGAQIRIAERAKKADAIALITLAAVLKDRDEEELLGVIKKGGPAAEAARLVLERRKGGLRPSGARPAER
jgi:hypothetical protein